MKLITSCNSTVVIDLPGGLLKLPSFLDYGHIYRIPTFKDNVERHLNISLVILSDVRDTVINVCGINNEDKTLTQIFKQTSKGDDSVKNCSTSRISGTGRYFLNDTLAFSSIKITSEHPICILQGHAKQSSDFIRKDLSFPLTSRIYWHPVPTLSKGDNKIILVPVEYRREYTFWIVCEYYFLSFF